MRTGLTTVSPLMRTSVFRVDVPGEPDAYIVELMDVSPQGQTKPETVCRVWLASKGDQCALTIPLQSKPKNISKKRMAQKLVCCLVALKQWRPMNEKEQA